MGRSKTIPIIAIAVLFSFLLGRGTGKGVNTFPKLSPQRVSAHSSPATGSPQKSRAVVNTRTSRLRPNTILLSDRRSFNLNLPEGFAITIAAKGLGRVRFMAGSPDGRIFVTNMHNRTDNKKGVVYILDKFDPLTKSFRNLVPYLTNLRNPNSIAFYRDPKGVDWFYLALTDRLLRYKYKQGENAPSAQPEVLATFPDYGLGYKYGGWHLTRTITVGGNGKIYVSVGSSCNACEEKEEVRASILEMDPDGKNLRHFARGLRNAVGMRWINSRLFATNMGADHLGDRKPADTMLILKDGANYGWPFCFQSGRRLYSDRKLNGPGLKMRCQNVPAAELAFEAHSSPLGFEYFDVGSNDELSGSFLVALHGSTKKSLNHGYKVMLLRGGRSLSGRPEDFINGFLQGGKVYGRPVDILSFGRDAFLLTDDHAGVIYYVYRK
jgi:glucose/arabinose dehydrogenase